MGMAGLLAVGLALLQSYSGSGAAPRHTQCQQPLVGAVANVS